MAVKILIVCFVLVSTSTRQIAGTSATTIAITTASTTPTTPAPKLHENCVSEPTDTCKEIGNASCIDNKCTCNCGYYENSTTCVKYDKGIDFKVSVPTKTASSMNITWTDISIPGRYFTVSLKQADGSCNTLTESSPKTGHLTETKIEMTGLTPGVTYEISVFLNVPCTTGGDLSREYPKLNNATDDIGSDFNVSVPTQTVTSMNITWTDITISGRYFTVSLKQADGSCNTLTEFSQMTGNITENQIEMTGLTPGVTYEISVFLHVPCKAGGNLSREYPKLNHATDAIGSDFKVNVPTKTASSMNITWTGINIPSRYFTVSLKHADGSCNTLTESSPKTGNLTETKIEMTGLTPGVTYEISVFLHVPCTTGGDLSREYPKLNNATDNIGSDFKVDVPTQTASSMTITWTDINISGRYFTVSLKQADGSCNTLTESSQKTGNLTETKIEMTGLTPGVTYEISVFLHVPCTTGGDLSREYPKVNHTTDAIGSDFEVSVPTQTVSSMTITWKDITIPGRHFTVSLKHADGSCNTLIESSQKTEDLTESQIEMTRLTPGVTYEISVFLHVPCTTGGGDDLSREYPKLNHTTDPAVLQCPKEEQKDTDIDKIHFEQIDPSFSSCNAIIDRLNEKQTFEKRLTSTRFNCETLTDSHIKPGIYYNLLVQVTECYVNSTPNSCIIHSPPQKPSKVEGLTLATASDPYHFTWNAPSNPNGYIQTYVILVYRENSIENVNFGTSCSFSNVSNGQIQKDTDETTKSEPKLTEETLLCETRINQMNISYATSIDVSGLTPDEPHKVSVRAINQAINGYDAVVEFHTSAYVPSKPDSLITETKSNSEIHLNWTKPTPYPGHTNYTIKVMQNDSNPTSVVQSINIVGYNNTSYLVKNLNSSTYYFFNLLAKTSAGSSLPIKSKPVRTWNETSDKVQDFHVVETTAYSIKLQWEKPIHINGQGNLKGFVVYVRQHRNNEKTHTCVAVYIISQIKETIDVNESEEFCQKPTNQSNERELQSGTISLEVNDLSPYVEYDFMVTTYNTLGPGEPTIITKRTDIGTPFPPTGIRCIQEKPSNDKLRIEWKSPVISTGPISYEVVVQESKQPEDTTEGLIDFFGLNTTQKNSIEIPNVRPHWTYRIKVKSKTEAGEGHTTVVNECLTDSAAPGLVKSLTVNSVPGSVFLANVTWECPVIKDRHGIMEKFVIDVTTKDPDSQPNQSIEIEMNNNECGSIYHKKIKIDPDIKYTFQVRAKVENVKDWGLPKSQDFSTETVLPPPMTSVHLNDTPVQASESSFTIQISCVSCLLNNSNGEITSTGVLVCPSTDCKGDLLHSPSKTWKDAHDKGFQVSYVCTKTNWTNDQERCSSGVCTIMVGEEKNCAKSSTKYCNGPLPSNRKFWVEAFSCTKAGCRYSEISGPFVTAAHTESNTSTIAGAASGVVAALVIIIIVVVIWRRRRNRSKQESGRRSAMEENGLSSTIPLKELKSETENWATEKRPVTIGDFEQNLNKLRMYENVLLNREFMELGNASPEHEMKEGLRPDNKLDNRWTNIIPFDHCRVKLSVDDKSENERSHDYINASFIPGVQNARRYIATQGPLKRTVGDFWRMVWEQSVCVIVMLSQFEEMDTRRGIMKEKVARYFPDEEESQGYQYDNIKVNRTGKVDNTIWEIRTLKLCSVQTKKCRFVKHFLFKSWTDHDADISPTHLLEFVNLVRQETKTSSQPEAPIVVHCSAGVGRTGTFLVVDYLNEYLENLSQKADNEPDFLQGKVDVFGTLLNMRNYRKTLVQTKIQYNFLYEAVSKLIQEKMKYFHTDDDLYCNIGSVNNDYDDDRCVYANAEVFEQGAYNNIDKIHLTENVRNGSNGQMGDESEYDDVEDLRQNITTSNRL